MGRRFSALQGSLPPRGRLTTSGTMATAEQFSIQALGACEESRRCDASDLRGLFGSEDHDSVDRSGLAEAAIPGDQQLHSSVGFAALQGEVEGFPSSRQWLVARRLPVGSHRGAYLDNSS